MGNGATKSLRAKMHSSKNECSNLKYTVIASPDRPKSVLESAVMNNSNEPMSTEAKATGENGMNIQVDVFSSDLESPQKLRALSPKMETPKHHKGAHLHWKKESSLDLEPLQLQYSDGNAEEIKSLKQEVELLSTLTHENIVAYLGTQQEGGNTLFVFTEWVPGGNLNELQAKFGILSERVVVKYTRQLLLGLEYLHENHVIHRDIKGANILVDDRGTVKLTDFGASKKMMQSDTLSSNNQSLQGTPYYMAPEVILQTGHGRKADIWSVGSTVHQMLLGAPPWKNLKIESAAALLYHIAHTKSPPELPDTLPSKAKSFIASCLRIDPMLRPSASDLLLHPFLQEPAEPLENVQVVQATSQPLKSPELLSNVEIQEKPATCAVRKPSPKIKNQDPSVKSETHLPKSEILVPAKPPTAPHEIPTKTRSNHSPSRRPSKLLPPGSFSARRGSGKLAPLPRHPDTAGKSKSLNQPISNNDTDHKSSRLASLQNPCITNNDDDERPFACDARDEQPIRTSYAQQVEKRRFEEEQKLEAQAKYKKALWEAALAAELEHQRQTF